MFFTSQIFFCNRPLKLGGPYWPTPVVVRVKMWVSYFSLAEPPGALAAAQLVIPHLTTRLQIRTLLKNYNNIDRPTKHSLPLANLTNLSSEWKVEWFCLLKKMCQGIIFIFYFFLSHCILFCSWSLYYKVKQIYTNRSTPSFHTILQMPRCKRFHFERRRQGFAPLYMYALYAGLYIVL